DIGEIILTRELHIEADDVRRPVLIEIAKPEIGDRCFECRYRITGLKAEPWLSAGFGVDSVQALLLTLEKIGIELYTSDAHKNGQLVWLEPGAGFGFPVTPICWDLLRGDDRRLDPISTHAVATLARFWAHNSPGARRAKRDTN